MAHAWTYHNLDDAARVAFVEHARLDTWGDHSYQHRVRGIDQAANAISWGIGVKRLEAGRVNSYDDYLYRYELLTGRQTLRKVHLDADA